MRAMWLALLIGCGGGAAGFPGGPGALTGTVHGQTFAIADTVSGILPITDIDGNIQHSAVVFMTTSPDACGDLTANVEHPNESYVLIGMSVITGLAFDAPTAPGAFTIATSTMNANWTASSLDGTCRVSNALVAKASAGTVTLTGVDGEAYGGTFDLTLDTSEHLTGEFGSTACPAVATAFAETNHAMPTCM